jgi:hypothetical protein
VRALPAGRAPPTDSRSSASKPATGERVLRLRAAHYGRRPREGGASIPHCNLVTGLRMNHRRSPTKLDRKEGLVAESVGAALVLAPL